MLAVSWQSPAETVRPDGQRPGRRPVAAGRLPRRRPGHRTHAGFGSERVQEYVAPLPPCRERADCTQSRGAAQGWEWRARPARCRHTSRCGRDRRRIQGYACRDALVRLHPSRHRARQKGHPRSVRVRSQPVAQSSSRSLLSLVQLAKLFAGAAQHDTRVRWRDSQHLTDLIEAKPVDLAQGNRGAQSRREREQRRVYLIMDGDAQSGVTRHQWLSVIVEWLEIPGRQLASLVERQIRRDTPHPGFWPLIGADLANMAPGAKKCLLCQIFGRLLVAEQTPQISIDTALQPGEDRIEQRFERLRARLSARRRAWCRIEQ